MNLTEIVCYQCGILKSIPRKEYNRAVKRGRERFFCSVSCGVKHSNTMPRKRSGGRVPWNKGVRSENPFLEHLRRARNRKSKWPSSNQITAEYLSELWTRQNGRCFLTKIPLEHSGNWATQASLDRIDPKKGYEIGNVRFVSVMTNLALSNKGDAEFLKFVDLIVEHHVHNSVTV